ncbi:MAG: DNA polymerase III subunit delta [bacterium]
MRINFSALPGRLDRGLAPLYHLFGGETLLIEEALEAIRARARADGFGERIRYTVEPGFDWERLVASGQSVSLFADKQLIELRMPSAKPGAAGEKALARYVEAMDGGDNALLVISGAIDRRAQNAKWFKQIESAGVAVECPAIAPAQLPAWVERRMRAKGLQFETAAAQRLSDFVEGNLLAAAQAINLLVLLFPPPGALKESSSQESSAQESSPKDSSSQQSPRKITVEAVESAIADHARFNVYAFVDACLLGSAERCTRILHSLRREQAEPVLILWALAKEMRALCHLSAGLARGERPQTLLKRHGVWSSRSGMVDAALRRLSARQCESLLRQLARVDLMLKGRAPMQRQSIWEEIERIGLQMCGLRIQ